MIALLLAASLLPNPPSLRVFGPGPFTNLGESHAANVNALAHGWFGMACPLALARWGGWRPRQAGIACSAAVLTREIFFHGPTPGPEVRTDLLSGLLPILAVVAIEAFR